MRLSDTWWGPHYIKFVDIFATKDNCVYCGIGRFGLFALLAGVFIGSGASGVFLVMLLAWFLYCYLTNGQEDDEHAGTDSTHSD